MPKPTHSFATAETKPRVTINDVSARLGLTKGTVSRALNGYSDISERTRLRVQRTARAMGYEPLTQAQVLRNGLSRTLGLVIQNFDHDRQRPFLAEFLAGISTTAAQAGWTLTVTAADSEAEMLALMKQLVQQRKSDGFILPRSRINDPRVGLLQQMEVPFVLFGRSETPEGCAWYDIKSGAAMRDGVHRLHALGHKRIGYVGGGDAYFYSRLRKSGFEAGLKDCGLQALPDTKDPTALTRSEGAIALRHLMGQPSPPTAVVFAVDPAALGAWDVAQDLGLEIGRDLSIMSYDGCAEGTTVTPTLATYAVDNRHAGARLTELLIRRIQGEPVEELRKEEDAQFRAGGSIGPPR